MVSGLNDESFSADSMRKPGTFTKDKPSGIKTLSRFFIFEIFCNSLFRYPSYFTL